MASVLVTGAGRGIGKSIVGHLAAPGCEVIAGMETVTPDEWRKQLENNELYARHTAGFKKPIPGSQKLAVPADKVAAVVEEALTARRPRPRYAVGVGTKLQVALMTNLPAPVRDRLLRRVSGQP